MFSNQTEYVLGDPCLPQTETFSFLSFTQLRLSTLSMHLSGSLCFFPRMCKALLPGDDESMSDEAIWETLPVSFSLTHYKLRVPEPEVFLFLKKLNYCSNCYPFRIAVYKLSQRMVSQSKKKVLEVHTKSDWSFKLHTHGILLVYMSSINEGI